MVNNQNWALKIDDLLKLLLLASSMLFPPI